MSSILISGTLEPQASLTFLLTRAPLHSTMTHMTPQEEAQDDIEGVLIPMALIWLFVLALVWCVEG